MTLPIDKHASSVSPAPQAVARLGDHHLPIVAQAGESPSPKTCRHRQTVHTGPRGY